MITLFGKYTNANIMIDEVEPECISQITKMINNQAFTNPVVIMPDTHAGKGSVIGFTMPLGKYIIPNVIGVDINCGMLGFKIPKEIDLNLERIDQQIRNKIPFGFDTHQKSVVNMNDFNWATVNGNCQNMVVRYNQKFGTNYNPIKYDMAWFIDKCEKIGCSYKRATTSLGTLGGGNHFIEFGKDSADDTWIIIHTGSRNFGKCICEYWQNIASKVVVNEKKEELRKEIEEIQKNYKGMEIKYKTQEVKAKYDLKSKSDLDFLEGEYAIGYLRDMLFTQRYAEFNRQVIAQIIAKTLGFKYVEDSIETAHNFIDFGNFIIRKGAIEAAVTQRMLIPLNPKDGTLVCIGKGNADWNYSAPHGAGRLMSRSAAKKNITKEQAEKALEGVFASQKPLDESPLAYKSSSLIEESIGNTALIIDRIKPILNMKSS